MWFWSGDPNRSCGFKFCTFHLREKWTTMLQKFLSLRQPTGGYKILISLPCTSKLIKNSFILMAVNACYTKKCIHSNTKMCLTPRTKPEYFFPDQIIIGSLRRGTSSSVRGLKNWTIDCLSGRRNVCENFSDWNIISSPDAAARLFLQNFSL
jgi:hypothetical protein